MLITALTMAACQWPPGRDGSTPENPAEPPIGPGTPVAVNLALLQAQLDTILATGLDDAAPARLERAEAISDRLLESRLPFAWLSAESYSVEARLRQIQTRTDRIGALVASGGRSEDVLAETAQLREVVVRLRSELEAGGTSAPPSIQQLLTTLDTARR